MDPIRRLLASIPVIVLLVVSMLCVMVGCLSLVGLTVFHDIDPKAYNEEVSSRLGLGCSMQYSLSDEDAARLTELGLKPNDVANAKAASDWVRSRFGVPVDAGIILVIYNAETANGTTFGSYPGLAAAASYSLRQWYCARSLLRHFGECDIRVRNSVAAEYILPGYVDYKGHKAGEMGPGFLPCTLKDVCEDGLANSGDEELKSCNVWSEKVGMSAIGFYVQDIGYRADQTYEEKVDNLYYWNHLFGYRQQLVSDAEKINNIIEDVDVESSMFAIQDEWYESLMGDIRLNLIGLLDDLGFLPEVSNWLMAPLRPEDIDEISQFWMDTRWDKDGHPGIDFTCDFGDDVIAVADGVVVEPFPWTLMGRLIGDEDGKFGYVVWIDHGGIYTISAHLQTVNVSRGQFVEQGQVVGECGSTGESTGAHVHFGVSNIHPNEFTAYHQFDPGWVDPNLYLGTCGVR